MKTDSIVFFSVLLNLNIELTFSTRLYEKNCNEYFDGDACQIPTYSQQRMYGSKRKIIPSSSKIDLYLTGMEVIGLSGKFLMHLLAFNNVTIQFLLFWSRCWLIEIENVEILAQNIYFWNFLKKKFRFLFCKEQNIVSKQFVSGVAASSQSKRKNEWMKGRKKESTSKTNYWPYLKH